MLVLLRVKQVSFGESLRHNEGADCSKLLFESLTETLVQKLVNELTKQRFNIILRQFCPDKDCAGVWDSVRAGYKEETPIREFVSRA